MAVMAWGVAAGLGLNLALLPDMGAAGAAWAVFANENIMFLAYAWMCRSRRVLILATAALLASAAILTAALATTTTRRFVPGLGLGTTAIAAALLMAWRGNPAGKNG